MVWTTRSYEARANGITSESGNRSALFHLFFQISGHAVTTATRRKSLLMSRTRSLISAAAASCRKVGIGDRAALFLLCRRAVRSVRVLSPCGRMYSQPLLAFQRDGSTEHPGIGFGSVSPGGDIRNPARWYLFYLGSIVIGRFIVGRGTCTLSEPLCSSDWRWVS